MGGLPNPKIAGAELLVAAPTRQRLDSIDLLRGLVMVLMALDHVRDFFTGAPFLDGSHDPTNLKHTTAAYFLTRWVTHFCAPVFLFLAGTGAFLYRSRGRSKGALAWFLFSRGVWLVVLELTVIRFGWSFNLDYRHDFGAGVFWAIGWAMIVLAGLVFLPTSAVATFGIAVIAYHNLLDDKSAAQVGLPHWLWVILHSPGGFPLTDLVPGWLHSLRGMHFGTGYSVLPWTGVMAAGYGLGALFLLEPGARRRQLLGLGLALTLLFVALRYTNWYGDPKSAFGDPPVYHPEGPGPWSRQDSGLYTVLSFLNCQKYPPSLLYLLMTLGPAITALGLFDRALGPVGRFLVTYGRVPLFYYVLHIFLIHGLRVGLDYLHHGSSPFANQPPWPLYGSKELPEGYGGYSLPMVYLIWAGVVLALYPFCRWYAGVKQRYRWAWLSYL